MFAPLMGGGTSGTGARTEGPAVARAGSEGERLARGFASSGERARVIRWLEAGLRPGRPGRLVREYPPCFSADSRAVPIVAWLGTEPAAFCLLLPIRFTLGAGGLGAGLVSLVFTEPRHRGRGLARRVVHRAVAEARAQGLALCLLWSEPGLEAFYAAQGFTRAGGETLVAFDRTLLEAALADGVREDAPAGPALRIEPACDADWPAIEALRAGRVCHAALAGRANAWLGIPDLEARVARRGSELAGFAMRGRGDDFEGVIHEWGGDTEAVLRCCGALLPDDPTAGLLLLAPRETTPVAWRLRSAGARALRAPLAWCQIACTEALGRDLASIVPELAPLSLGERGEPGTPASRLRLRNTKTDRAIELAEADLLRALLGEAEPGRHPIGRALLRPVLAEHALARLPLPLFVSGLESI